MDAKFQKVYADLKAKGASDADILGMAEQSQRYGETVKKARDMGISDGAIFSGLKAGTLSVMANPEREIPTNLERMGRGGADFKEGGTQVVRNIANMVSPGSGGDVKEYTKQRDRENKAYEEGRSQGSGAGFDWVRQGTKVAATAPLFGFRALQGAALVPRMGWNALAGAATAGIDYVPEGGSRARNMVIGGLLASGLSGAFGGRAQQVTQPNAITGADELVTVPAGNGVNFVRAMLAPATQGGQERIVGDSLTRAAGGPGMADDAINALRDGQSAVPGVNPTAAELANNQGISALQGVIGSQNKAQFAARRIDNNAARLNYLRQNGAVAEADDVARAVAQREQASQAAFEAARGAQVQPDEALTGLLNRPAAQNAIPAVNEIRANQGLPPMDIANPTAGDLHLIAQQIRMANTGGTANAAGITRLAGGAAGDVGTGITGWLENNVPQFSEGMNAFRQGSIPVNRAQVGQEIGQRLQANQILDDAGQFTVHPSKVGGVVNRLDDIVSNVTGMPRQAADVLAPEQINALQTVADDLRRLQFADEGAKAVGSNTYQNLSYDNLVSSTGMPWVQRAPGLQRAANWLYSGADEDMRAMLANALLHPERAAQLMDVAAGRGDPGVMQAVGRVLLGPTNSARTQQSAATLMRNGQGR